MGGWFNKWFFFFQAEDGIRDIGVTGVQTCALPISEGLHHLLNRLPRTKQLQHLKASPPQVHQPTTSRTRRCARSLNPSVLDLESGTTSHPGCSARKVAPLSTSGRAGR